MHMQIMFGEAQQANRPRADREALVWQLLLPRFPCVATAARLGTTCRTAAAAARAHFANLSADLSLGSETLLVPVEGTPAPVRQGEASGGSSSDRCTAAIAPLPLRFTYVADPWPHHEADGLAAALGGPGCSADCECCCSNRTDGPKSGSSWGAGSSTVSSGDQPGALGGSQDVEKQEQKQQRTKTQEQCGCGVVVPGGHPAYTWQAVKGSKPEEEPRALPQVQATGTEVCRPLPGQLVSGCDAGAMRHVAVLSSQAPGASPDPRGLVGYILECGPACACTAPVRTARACWTESAPAACTTSADAGPGPAARSALGADDRDGDGGSCSVHRHDPGLHHRCPHRVSQWGLQFRVALQWGRAGWGVVAREHVPAGAYVCNYAGEYVSSTEAARRLDLYDKQGAGHALLAVRETLPSGLSLRVNIDATCRGNVARFFNHSCDGGTLAMVLVRRRGGLLPAVGLFAARDIAAGEELTFCYGGGGDAGEAGAAGVGQAGGNSNTPRAAVDGDETPGIGNRPVAGRESAEMGGAGSAGVCEGGAGGGSGAVARASPRSGNGEHASRAGGGGVGVRRRVVCLCGTPACRGYLPAEDV